MLIKGVRVVLRVLEENKFGNLSSFCKLNTKMSKTALVFLAPGAEEMELVISIDVLRRGGFDVSVAGICDASPIVKCSRGVSVKPDILLSDAKGPYDILVLPGGLGGAQSMARCKAVGEMLKQQENESRWIAAICAAPTVLKAHGVGLGKSLTSYPSMKDQLKDDYKYQEDKVVVDGKLITSRGPGTAYDFALTIIDKLIGKEKASEVANAMLLTY
ncbi:protein dj-1beta isoform X2 [Anoplophora glabripennis]|uniref:protein dj-1beta isoform X2 n=1 Tax=Anoplophora glabripennis TaxID=217634 RepID=UPI000874066B|nr:protein dj-1beta isoform X2 [Anoplophora glabripennis]